MCSGGVIVWLQLGKNVGSMSRRTVYRFPRFDGMRMLSYPFIGKSCLYGPHLTSQTSRVGLLEVVFSIYPVTMA